MAMKGLKALAAVSLLIITLFALTMLGGSVGFEFKENLKVNDDSTTGEQTNPSMAVLGDNVYLIWEDARNGDKDIYFGNSSDGGSTFGPNIRVDDDGGSSAQTEPDIAVDSQGRIHVVWSDNREGIDHIYYSNSSDGGQNWVAAKKIDDATQNERSVPSISVSNNGHIYVAWTDQREDAVVKNRNIYFTSSIDNGTSWAADKRLHDPTPYIDQRDPDVASYNSYVYVAWTDDSSSDKGVHFVRSLNDGGTFTAPIDLISSEPSTTQEKVSMDVDATGNLYAVWKDNRQGVNIDIYFTRSVDNGASWGTHVLAVDASTSCQNPVVNAFNSTYCSVAWHDTTSVDDDVWYKNSTDGGQTWGDTIRVDDTDTNVPTSDDATYQTVPTGGFDKYGRALVAWADNRHGNRDIYFTKSFVAGPGIDTPPFMDSFDLSPATGNATSQFLFKLNYQDDDGDMPNTGYPQMRIFLDAGATSEHPDSPFEMSPITPLDLDVTDGKMYYVNVANLTDGSYWHQFEIQSMAQDVNVSAVFSGPVIDGILPSFGSLEPVSGLWYNFYPVMCNMTVNDMGSGIDMANIEYSTSVHGPTGFERWYKVSPTYIETADNLTVNVSIASPTWKSFPDGDDNYIKWRVWDAAGNGPVESDMVNIKFDETNPIVTFYTPTTLQVPDADIIISFDDRVDGANASGMNLSSMEYSISYNTTDEADFGAWLSLTDNVTASDGVEQINVTLDLTLPAGTTHIRVRGEDMAENPTNKSVSIDVTLADNFPPTAPTNATPTVTADTTPRISWVGATDPDGDQLIYMVMIGTAAVEDYIIPWTSVGTDEYYNVITPLREDITYIIQIKSFDGEFYSGVAKFNLTISAYGNEPPTNPSNLQPLVTEDLTPTITWDPSTDANNDTISYMVQIIDMSTGLPIIPWQGTADMTSFDIDATSPLDPGFYRIEVQATDGHDYSDLISSIMKIGFYDTEITIDTPGTMNRTEVGHGTLSLVNKGAFSDNITIELSGTILDVIQSIKIGDSMQVTTNSTSIQLMLNYNQTRNLPLEFRFKATAAADQYTLEAILYSETGDETSRSTMVVIKVQEPGAQPNGTDGGDGGDGGGDGMLSPSRYAGYWWILLIIVAVVIIIIIIAVVVSNSKAKKDVEEQREQQKAQHHEDLYAQSDTEVEYVPGTGRKADGWGAPPPAAPVQPQTIEQPSSYYQDTAPSPSYHDGGAQTVDYNAAPMDTPQEPVDLDYTPPGDLDAAQPAAEPVDEDPLGLGEDMPEDEEPKDIFGYDDEDLDADDEDYMNIDDM